VSRGALPARPDEVVVGFIANPRSGHDVRRLVARASVFPNTEKVMMLQRVLTSLGAVGVHRVVVAGDAGGIAAGLLRAVDSADRSGLASPRLELLELALTDSGLDTVAATEALVALGVRVLVVLGGDGTDRLVAKVCGDVPMLPLSTGTNNAFAPICEASVAGLAAGLVAIGRLSREECCRRNKVLLVEHAGRRDLALVDVAMTTASGVGARALWNATDVTELFVTFAEPSAVGLSSIAGLVRPLDRDTPAGLHLTLRAEAEDRLLAPIAPGLVRQVGVATVEVLRPGEARRGRATDGVVALDGEREIELRGVAPAVTLRVDGPWSLDVSRAMRVAASRRLLTS
jgi:predicted polyphosphate/ATP-dependent NAD kinase